MKYQWKDLKPGMVIFRDRDEDVYRDSEYFSYIEVLTISDLDDGEKKITRQHVYIYGKPNTQGDKWGGELAGGSSSPDPMWMSDLGWTTAGWHSVNFYTEEEIKRRITSHCFNQ